MLMEELSVNYVLSFKNHPDLQTLDQASINYINKLHIYSDKKHNSSIKKINNHILKNPKLQNKKDNLDNKVNLILNKLSENNILNLINDFITTIGKITNLEYELVQKTIYSKIISEINFVNIYLKFLILINQIYNKVFNYDLSFFINLIEKSFVNNYNENSENNDENTRVNNLTLIRTLVSTNILSKNILIECTKMLFAQSKYIPDIYFWFSYDINITTNNSENIKKVLNTAISTRERVLLESLLTKPIVNKVEKVSGQTMLDQLMVQAKLGPVPDLQSKPTNMFGLEINNILEEYTLLDNIDDVIYFINNKCNDSLDKNKFCENLFANYFNFNNYKLIELLKVLYKNNINKLNITKGITLYKKNNKYDDKKITELLQQFE